MKISNIPLKKLYTLKVGFEEIVVDDVKAFKEQMGPGTFNAKHGLGWDLTYRNISSAAKKIGMIVIDAKRGFWEFNLALDLATKELIVFMKEANTNIAARTDYHYFNSLAYKHDVSEIDLLADVYKENEDMIKEKIVREILGEYADSYEKVLIMSKDVEAGKVIKTSLKLYSSDGELVDSEVIPNLPNNDDGGKSKDNTNNKIKGISLKGFTKESDENKKLFDKDNLKVTEESEENEDQI